MQPRRLPGMERGVGWDRGLGSAPTALRAAKIPFLEPFKPEQEAGCPQSPRTLRLNPLRAAGRAKSGGKTGENRARWGGKQSGAKNRRSLGPVPASQTCKLCSHFTGHLGVNLQRGSGGKLGT